MNIIEILMIVLIIIIIITGTLMIIVEFHEFDFRKLSGQLFRDWANNGIYIIVITGLALEILFMISVVV